MHLIDILLPELRIEAGITRQVLARMPQESWAWRPHDRSRTLGEVGAHIANLPGLFIGYLSSDELDRESVELPGLNRVSEVLDTFEKNIQRAESVLSQLSDERLLESWRYRYGARVVFEMPRFVVVRTTALNHVIHHRGQLSLYLRLLNVPVPAIYGPTADES